MLDMSLLVVCVLFVSVGLMTPFVWGLGYVWVDTLLPHRLSFGLFNSVPLAFIMGAGAFGFYLAMDRRTPPKLSIVHYLCFAIAIWISLTTTWAVVPAAALVRWDWSVKAVLFATFTPFIFRSRVQIEAFLLVLLAASASHLMPWGVKTVLNGGGYGLSLGLLGSNSTALAESSAVSAITVMFIPLLVWFRTYSLIIPWKIVRTASISGLIPLYLFANIGTFARTGVIALGMLATTMLLKTKRKVTFIIIALILGATVYTATSDKWTARISTISDYEREGSALTRLLIWKWTLGYVAEHPLGGGFEVYRTNVIVSPEGPDGKVTVQYGRAFHNNYFALLGEHGYIGLGIYLAIIVFNLMNMTRVIKYCKTRPEMDWAADLARGLQLGFLILMVCGNFIDISFNFIVWDMIGLMLCLHAHVQRVRSQDRVVAPAPTGQYQGRPALQVPAVAAARHAVPALK